MLDLHTANLKFMNSTVPAHHHHYQDSQGKIKIADLNNALDNIMTMQGAGKA